MGCFDKALEDAGEFTAEVMNTEKGLYRVQLGRFMSWADSRKVIEY